MGQEIVCRGDVYLVSFDPSGGSEIKKTRPALILQNDIDNRYSPLTIVAAITSWDGKGLYPTEVLIRSKEAGLLVDSVVLLNQIRMVDKACLIKRLGMVKKHTLVKVNMAMEISLGLFDI